MQPVEFFARGELTCQHPFPGGGMAVCCEARPPAEEV